jgi:hypothetical protein
MLRSGIPPSLDRPLRRTTQEAVIMAHAHLAVSVVAFGAIGLTAGACTLGSDTYIYATEAARPDSSRKADASASSDGSSLGASATCFEAVDLSKLTPCGNGAGHCLDEARAPLSGLLTRCPKSGEVCVPDEALLAAGGTLKSCTSIVGPGGCITSALVPKLDEQKGVLKQDVCGAGQLCTPCVDPTNNNAPTPFCQSIGAFKTKDREAGCGGAGGTAPDAGTGGTAPETCCTSGGTSHGVCTAPAAVSPAGYQSTASQGTCKGASDRCVPTAIQGRAPVRCTSTYPSAAKGKAGICLDTCFSDAFFDAAWKPLVTQTKDCSATELCLPCDALLAGTPGCP